jgi:hypothetical protein
LHLNKRHFLSIKKVAAATSAREPYGSLQRPSASDSLRSLLSVLPGQASLGQKGGGCKQPEHPPSSARGAPSAHPFFIQ